MDIISQLQEQVNTIAAIAFNTFGTLQRDAPPVRLSPNYPEPPSAPAAPTAAAGGAAANGAAANPSTEESPSNNISETPKLLSAELVKAAKQFDALVAALPFSEGGEEAQLKKIEQLQAENDLVGQELQKQLEAADKELKQVQELFNEAADNCLNLKKPD
ncbi:putative mediator complex, subunit Med21, mediator complex, subunit Med7/Med21 [Helianthus annuus]|uniref:Mediator of RNA polymerase II transcription subunit 21 n=1 Tax=Helianthus annuus TaxID=4232 RepID=A0A251TGG9_HELAN|nr:mediator of RNA polymerase II transcription subunit 21 [Helianthus annuus]KAF5782761.1 putative mediator complex, subunit Med21, mediator complex, subunit Med7/Med21 [Helianthus annuus]KAJ0502221.1 putative mediator complex, subunit Med21, mediator complex, subunit Med7/Med21 [Helianthus annuus]KAJ0510213.1 putative mediator complex, subunit Med21, mediator complex, subunit Med7/Med21 [Helianthus annuus]KAJ0518144.1 putative mediator complex, subunit Med21, mediator complex, subunit Med7/Med